MQGSDARLLYAFAIIAAIALAVTPKPSMAAQPAATAAAVKKTAVKKKKAPALPAQVKAELPVDGAQVNSAGAFTWAPAKRADSYEFQISADPGFRSTVAGAGQGKGLQRVRNTAATLAADILDGTYFWRVRGVNTTNHAGKWSTVRKVTKTWSDVPVLMGPLGGISVPWPAEPTVLSWNPVPRAAKYRVTIATDPGLGNIVIGPSNRAEEVPGARYAIPTALAPGQYYWTVTAVDADGHVGQRSPVGSFTWVWPDEPTNRRVSDLDARDAFTDIELSWDRVPGALSYEVDVNTSSDFPAGSKVCCDKKVVGTTLAPPTRLPNNDYFWRVRAFDVNGNTGAWYQGPRFSTAVGKVANLHVEDVDGNPITGGQDTTTPIVRWDPVPGASSYQVQTAPYVSNTCDWVKAHTDDTTATAWTPLAKKPAGEPGPSAWPVSTYDPAGDYSAPQCVRVLARQGEDAKGKEVVGPWAYATDAETPVFSWSLGEVIRVNASNYCAPDPSMDPLDASQLKAPAPQQVVNDQPVYRWAPIPGARSYFVVISRDADFTNIAQVAFTYTNVFATRGTNGKVFSIADETAETPQPYWWTVIPARKCDGSLAAPLRTAQSVRFTYDSYRPTPLSPAAGAAVPLQPTFHWTAVPGALTYRLQIAVSPDFGTLLDDATISETAYTTTSTLPADSTLYWRVRATGETGLGMKWTAPQPFVRPLDRPVLAGDISGAADHVPLLRWQPVPGAVSYDVHLEGEKGDDVSDGKSLSTATTFTTFKGTGRGTYIVRAHFPTLSGDTVGPWSDPRGYERPLDGPSNVKGIRTAARTLISWDAAPGAEEYKVEISRTNAFGSAVQTGTVSTTSFAPSMTGAQYLSGGKFYWRVTSLDNNALGGSATGQFSLLGQMTASVSGQLRRKARGVVTLTLRRPDGAGVEKAKVVVTGKGLKRVAKSTGKKGVLKLKLRPSRTGNLTVTVTKKGYLKTTTTLKVR